MHGIIAIDAGGTHTRAVVATRDGKCLGLGTAANGNPTSAGLDAAMASVTAAIVDALTRASEVIGTTGAGRRPLQLDGVLAAMAGHGTTAPVGELRAAVQKAGVRSEDIDGPVLAGPVLDSPVLAGPVLDSPVLDAPVLAGPVLIESDILAMFCSGTPAHDGYALVSGTGAAAMRIRDLAIDKTVDGAGWLLGDHGSGFWIGRKVVRAVTADLDGLGPTTALTGMLLHEVGLRRDRSGLEGRERTLSEFIDVLYALEPVQLSRFSPLAFAASDDRVAHNIVTSATDALRGSLDAVLDDDVTGPLVLGGSVLTAGIADSPALFERLCGTWRAQERADAVLQAADGVIGAVVLALTRIGVRVDEQVFARITRSLARTPPR